jgi:hypothetical protein
MGERILRERQARGPAEKRRTQPDSIQRQRGETPVVFRVKLQRIATKPPPCTAI